MLINTISMTSILTITITTIIIIIIIIIIILTDGGEVLAFGSNEHGQLGLGRKVPKARAQNDTRLNPRP